MRHIIHIIRGYSLLLALAFATLAFATLPGATAQAQESEETRRLTAEKIVSQAADILGEFEADSHEWEDVIAGNFKRAKAVLLVPSLYKAGFFIGGEKGEGVLLVRSDVGQWSHPVFYELYAVSLGFQFGAQKSKQLLLIMSDKALAALQTSNFDFGGDLNVAVGTAGGSLETTTTANLGVDIFTYSLGAGAYAGVSLEGGKISYAQELNDSYYSSYGTVSQGVIAGDYHNVQADRLRNLVSDYAD